MISTRIHRITFLLLFLIPLNIVGQSQDVYQDYRESWLRKSERFKPELYSKIIEPVHVVEINEDGSSYQNLKMIRVSWMDEYYQSPLKSKRNDLIIDFGGHMVGRIQFVIKPTLPAHAPVQLKFTFGEAPSELKESFNDYQGTLSKAWLQEEIITVHTMPDTVILPHRYAFRYLKIEHMASAGDLDFYIIDIFCESVSSASLDLGETSRKISPEFGKISDVSIKTLQDCMQTVFEDGPKRDRRIWIGDFKLQALANYYSFQNTDLVKRGLYLFAATASKEGLVYGTVFEQPWPHPQEHLPIDYCLLYNTILTDYYEATGDLETIEDLWIVARQQVLQIMPYINEKGIIEASPDWWTFIDWNEELDKQTSLQGIAIYTLNKTWELAKILKKQDEIPHLPILIESMKEGVLENYYDQKTGLFTSSSSKQVSTASQTWMILSGTVSPADGKLLFGKMFGHEDLIKPVSPYLYHYVVEAMITCSMYQEARELLQQYWGGMISKGADTFWEVYDPENDYLSPYGSIQMNSYCHAWSCTPVYFIRKYSTELF
ncbi:MAG: glycoside hydrolase [Bacteroidales bacterium]